MLNNNATSYKKFYNARKVKHSKNVLLLLWEETGNGLYCKAPVQPYPVESVEIVEWLLCVEWVDILLVVDWGDFISTPTYTGILERLRHYHRNVIFNCTDDILCKCTTMKILFAWELNKQSQKRREENQEKYNQGSK